MMMPEPEPLPDCPDTLICTTDGMTALATFSKAPGGRTLTSALSSSELILLTDESPPATPRNADAPPIPPLNPRTSAAMAIAMPTRRGRPAPPAGATPCAPPPAVRIRRGRLAGSRLLRNRRPEVFGRLIAVRRRRRWRRGRVRLIGGPTIGMVGERIVTFAHNCRFSRMSENFVKSRYDVDQNTTQMPNATCISPPWSHASLSLVVGVGKQLRGVSGDPHGESGPGTGRGGRRHLTAVPLGRSPHDRQSQARAGKRPRIGGSIEAVKHMRQVFGVNTRTLVGDGQHAVGQPHRHRRSDRTVFDGVVQEIRDGAFQ